MANTKFSIALPNELRLFLNKRDVVFSDDGESVSYYNYQTYFWAPELSCETCSLYDDYIMTVNPVYWVSRA